MSDPPSERPARRASRPPKVTSKKELRREERKRAKETQRALEAQGVAILKGLIARFRDRLEDPDYRPTPGDLVGTLQAIEKIDTFTTRVKRLRGLMTEVRAEMQRLNDDLFAMASRPV